MNLNKIKSNYSLLSKRERFALLHAALCRGDSAEIEAVKAASPQIDYAITDYGFFFEQVLHLQHLILIERIGYAQSALDILNLILKDEARLLKKFPEAVAWMRLSAYQYVALTDGWRQALKEFGLSADDYEKYVAEQFQAVERLGEVDDLLRDLVMSEETKKRFPNAPTAETFAQTYINHLKRFDAI